MKLGFGVRLFLLTSLIIVLTLASADRRAGIRAAACPTNVVITTNADSGAGSLRQAIADVCDGGTITFADTVVSPIVLTSGQLLIDAKGLTIQGPGTRPMIISGNGANRVIQTIDRALDIQVTLSGLTIANGAAGEGP